MAVSLYETTKLIPD